MNNWCNPAARSFTALLLLAGSGSALGSALPGSLDTSFDPGTGVDQSVFAMAIQPDGKIVIGGDFTTVNGGPHKGIARLKSDGTVDSEFDAGTGPNDLVSAVAIQGNKIIIAGYFTEVSGINQGYVARLDTNGTLDTNFNIGTGADGPVLALVVQPDGKILLGGTFSTINHISRTNIARLKGDGSLDTDFDPGTGVGSDNFPTVNSLGLQSDGKVVIGGAFDAVNGEPRNNIARLNTNGVVDAGFVPNVGVGGAGLLAGVNALGIQSDDKILICGDFTSVAGSPRTNIARLTAAGSVDVTFNPAAVADSAVSAVAVDNNGRILIGGFFTHVNGTPQNYIARLSNVGGLDSRFDPGTGPNDAVYTTAIQTNGRALIGGVFATFNSTPRHAIARLKGDVSVRLFNPTHSVTTFSASVATELGYNYVLEYKDSISDSTWTALPAVAGDGTIRPLIDPSASVPRRFYRAEVQ